jgi:cytochrome c553
MNKWLLSLSIAAALMACGTQAMAGDAAAGKAKSATCTACHNADGNSVNPIWPKLAGQHAGYLESQLQAFKSGQRKEPTMTAMAAPLSEEDMADLAAWFASQKQTPGSADPALADAGGKLYRGGNADSGVSACQACHTPNGDGNPAAGFPAISGQHAAYVEKALKDYRSGDRGASEKGKMMRGVAAEMTDAEIAAVAQYVQGLQ